MEYARGLFNLWKQVEINFKKKIWMEAPGKIFYNEISNERHIF